MLEEVKTVLEVDSADLRMPDEMTMPVFPGSPVRFGLFGWLAHQERPAAVVFAERIKLARYANQAGLYCLESDAHRCT